jgi:photosystem II stability/assembly factor-like uncharacterized protein
MKNSIFRVLLLRRWLSLRLSVFALCGATTVFLVVSVHAGNQTSPFRALSTLITHFRAPSNRTENVSDKTKVSIAPETTQRNLLKQYGELPLSFEINEGQADQQVKFLSRGPGYDLFLTAEAAVLSLRKPLAPSLTQPPPANSPVNSAQSATVLRLKMIGAKKEAVAEGEGEMPGKVNYFIGNASANWHTNIPTYRQVIYKDVYAGVNLVYYGNQRQLEYDFVIAAGADPNVIKFRIDGANRIMLAKSGDLQLLVNDGTVTLQKPGIYQLDDDGNQREVKGEYVIKGNEIGFKVKTFDSRKPLIIDPVLSYSTLLGTGSNEQGNSIAVDSQGNAYVTGVTSASNFPTTVGAFQTAGNTFGGVFVTKIDPTGTSLVYSTYLAGSGTPSNNGIGNGIAVDSSGNAFVTGYTSAADFPTLNPLRGGRNNLLITADGGSSWAPSNVGALNRSVQSLAIDKNSPSTIYAGTGLSGGIFKSTDGGATWSALNTGVTNASCPAIVIDPTSSNILYAALVPQNFGSATGIYKSINGGNTWTSSGLNGTQVFSLAIDPQNPLTLYASTSLGLSKSINGGASWANANTGLSFGGGSPIIIDPTTPTTLYTVAGGGGVFKSTNSAGNWSQVNNGLTNTTVRALAIDPTAPSTLYAGTAGGGVFKTTDAGASWSAVNNGPSLSTGNMSSLAIVPTSTATVFAGTSDGRILKSTNAGGSWSTVYTTTTNTSIRALAIDAGSPAKVVAGVDSTNLNLNSPDVFVTKLNPSGSALLYSTFVGGLLDDEANAIAIDVSGNAYIAGLTTSSDYPTVNPAQAAFAGGQGCTDAFITKLNPSGSALSFSTYLGGTGCDRARAIALDNSGNVYVGGQTASSNLATPGAFQTTLSSAPFGGDAFAARFSSGGALGYFTYLGGNGDDFAFGIATDGSGNAYVTGQTTSTNFPTANAIQSTMRGSNGDAFVTKVNPAGSALIYSTYLGGSDGESGNGIAVDLSGNAYVTGYSSSIDFPLVAGALRTKSPLFKSSDGGNNWSNENFGFDYGQINALAIDPTASAKVYAGTPLNNFRSVDGGRTWTSSMVGLFLPVVTSIAVNPSTPSTVYLTCPNTGGFNASRGVYKSTDGGQSWNSANNGMNNAGAVSIVIDPNTPSTLYTVTGSALFKSVDSAGTWNKIGPQTFSLGLLVIDPVTPTTLYAARDGSGFNSGVFKSTDSGVNWQAINNGLTSGFIYHLALDPTTPTTLYAAAGSGGLFKSTNGGGSWTIISTTLQGPIAVDPSNPANIYAVGTNNSGLFKSADGGATWKAINNGLRSSSIMTIVVSPTNSSIVYVGTSLSTTDLDAFITKLNPSGNAFVYSTLLGGSSTTSSSVATDDAFAIALDSAGSAYITGLTVTNDFPSNPNSYQPFNRGLTDAFVAKLGNSFIISGQVLDPSNAPVSNAQVTVSDGSSLMQVFTESDGFYQFSHLREGGSFTVSAAKPHYTMAPARQTFNNLSANQTLNFVATATNAPFFNIAGQITNNGSGLSGVTVTLSGSQQSIGTTDNGGNYSFTLAGGGNYTVTPSIVGFSFTPPNQTFNNLSANQTANFAGTRQNFVVTNANDHGTGSLRQAILDANATPGLDTITFNIPGPGIQTINLVIGLPDITDPVTIDATTQPGYAAAPLIELSGAQAGSGANGFKVTSGSSTIRGFAINRFDNAGIALITGGNNIIQGNYIGLDPSGTIRRANRAGISLSASSNNTIGGLTPAARNVVSSNTSSGITGTGSNNVVQGNFIGTNPAGTAALGNGIGIELFMIVGGATSNNVIGGTTAGAGNLISGNQLGIRLNSSSALVQGNLIGTDISGTLSVPNGTGIDASNFVANPLEAIIGGTAPGTRNIISGNSGDGVIVGAGVKLQGNFIGTDITGTLRLGNGGNGVVAGNGALVGGTTPEARNIISGNGSFGNVSLGSNSSGNAAIVQGNYIGTDVSGNIALNNPSAGISISSSSNQIGGLIPGAQNVISGNRIGIQVGGSIFPGPVGNIIQGNTIGLNAAGTAALPNTAGGIQVSDASNTTIGGSASGAGNKILFNGGPGVMVSSGTGNSIRGNTIFSNEGLGIDLGSVSGVTQNDVGDSDSGANNLQNFPVLTSVTSNGGSTSIQGIFNSIPNTTFRIDFYSNTACDPSGNGEGALFFDTTNVTTDANGNASINFVSAIALPAGRAITATAVDPSGNTSEFSPCDSTSTSGSVQFSSASYVVLEDVGNAVVKVSRVGGSKGTLSINYSTADGTATAGSDYASASGTLIFADGETTKTILIPIANDGVTEPDETVRLSLTGFTSLETLGSHPGATIIIQGNDTPLLLSGENIGVIEGNSGTTNVTVPVVLSAQTSRTITVNYNTSGGSATSGIDFTPVSGTLTFGPGETTQIVTVSIIGDTLNETNEVFALDLSNPVNATVMSLPIITILNDDPLPALSITDVMVNEGNSGSAGAVFNVNLSAPSGRSVSVSFNTANGTALSGNDYASSSGSVIFSPGQTTKTITVQVNGDAVVEPNETFLLNLFSAFNATISRAQGIGTILDDDGQTPLQLILEDGSNQAAAVDSLLFVRDPFYVLGIAHWLTVGSDPNTRLLVLVKNLQLNQSETASAVEVNLVNGNFSATIPAEDVRAVPNSDLSQVRFRLPDNLPTGICVVSVKLHGQSSNTGIFRVVQ